MFRIVNFGENVMNSSADSFVVFPSFCPLSCSLCLHHLVLLSNVKWVNVGINTTEGCATIVLRMFLCQQEATPRRRPGKNIVATRVAFTGTLCSLEDIRTSSGDISRLNGENSAFPNREKRQAAKRSRNLEDERMQINVHKGQEPKTKIPSEMEVAPRYNC